MFDIGFFEICLIGIIALLVIGPEKLPRVARTAGLWLGRARGMVKTVKYEIDEQIRMEELKQSMKQTQDVIQESVSKSADEVEKSFESIQNTIKEDSTNDSATASPTTKPAK
jgi:sec-independent protein translocase protein TatB